MARETTKITPIPAEKVSVPTTTKRDFYDVITPPETVLTPYLPPYRPPGSRGGGSGRGGSGGGGMSTPETPTPSASDLYGSAAQKEAQIAAFRSGGQAALQREVERIKQLEIQQRLEKERQEAAKQQLLRDTAQKKTDEARRINEFTRQKLRREDLRRIKSEERKKIKPSVTTYTPESDPREVEYEIRLNEEAQRLGRNLSLDDKEKIMGEIYGFKVVTTGYTPEGIAKREIQVVERTEITKETKPEEYRIVPTSSEVYNPFTAPTKSTIISQPPTSESLPSLPSEPSYKTFIKTKLGFSAPGFTIPTKSTIISQPPTAPGTSAIQPEVYDPMYREPQELTFEPVKDIRRIAGYSAAGGIITLGFLGGTVPSKVYAKIYPEGVFEGSEGYWSSEKFQDVASEKAISKTPSIKQRVLEKLGSWEIESQRKFDFLLNEERIKFIGGAVAKTAPYFIAPPYALVIAGTALVTAPKDTPWVGTEERIEGAFMMLPFFGKQVATAVRIPYRATTKFFKTPLLFKSSVVLPKGSPSTFQISRPVSEFGYVSSEGETIVKQTRVLTSSSSISVPGEKVEVTTAFRKTFGFKPIYEGTPYGSQKAYEKTIRVLMKEKGWSETVARQQIRLTEPIKIETSSTGIVISTFVEGEAAGTQAIITQINQPIGAKLGGRVIAKSKTGEMRLLNVKLEKAILPGKEELEYVSAISRVERMKLTLDQKPYTPLKWQGKTEETYQQLTAIKEKGGIKLLEEDIFFGESIGIYDTTTLSKRLIPSKKLPIASKAKGYIGEGEPLEVLSSDIVDTGKGGWFTITKDARLPKPKGTKPKLPSKGTVMSEERKLEIIKVAQKVMGKGEVKPMKLLEESKPPKLPSKGTVMSEERKLELIKVAQKVMGKGEVKPMKLLEESKPLKLPSKEKTWLEIRDRLRKETEERTTSTISELQQLKSDKQLAALGDLSVKPKPKPKSKRPFELEEEKLTDIPGTPSYVGGTGENLRSAYAGTRSIFAGGQGFVEETFYTSPPITPSRDLVGTSPVIISSEKIKGLSLPRLDQGELTKTKEKTLTVTATKLGQIETQLPLQKSIQETKQKEGLKLLQVSLQKSRQRELQAQKTSLLQKLKERPKPVTPKTPTIPLPLPLSSVVTKAIRRVKEKPSSVEAIGFRFGKEVKLGGGTKAQAEFKLGKFLSTTLGASGFLEKKSGEKIKAEEVSLLKSPSYRKSKISPFIIVEKKERRLKRGTQETPEIQYFRKRSKK